MLISNFTVRSIDRKPAKPRQATRRRAAHSLRTDPPYQEGREATVMAHINIYSKSHCVQCDGILRIVNSAINDGTISASQVTVHMIDGTEPRADKVHERIEVIRIEDVDEQANLIESFRKHPDTGTSFPVVFVQATKDADSKELAAFSGLNPNSIKAAITTASEDTPALAATA